MIDGSIPYIIFIIFCSNLKNENSLIFFSKIYTFITKKKKSKIFKGKKIDLKNLLTTQKIFFMRKYELTNCNICLCKGVYGKNK
jgi:hypothetical protein